jgi:hypothetical protein
MLTVIAVGLSLLVQASSSLQPGRKVFIPTSVALEVAQKVATNNGFAISNKLYFFDLETTKDGKPALPGYITFGFFGNSNPLLEISINESTGQIVDSVRCLIFEYPDLKRFQEDLRRETGARPISNDELATSIGCDSFQVLSRPARHRVRR